MIRREDVLAYAIAGTAIFVFAVLMVFALFRLAGTEAEMRENEGDNMLWALLQAQSAVLLLDAEIARQAGMPQDTAEVERRYNVVLSRLALLNRGPQARYLASLGLGDNLAAAAQAIRSIEPEILGISHGDVETAATIHDVLAPLIHDLGRAGNQSMVRQWDATGARLDRHRASIIQVIVSILALIVLGIILSVVVLRGMAQRQRLMRSFVHEQEVAEAYRSFVALASHQFRTPLAVIDSSMQRLLRSGRGMTHDEIEERAGHVREEVRGLNELIGATLDVVRLDAGQVSANPSDCDIERLVNRVRASQLEATPDRAIIVRIGREVPSAVTTDPLLAEQVLGNLVSNAVKYSPPSEAVSIHVTAGDGQIVFAVGDRGVGIPQDEQDRLFGRFFRASTAQGVPGTGIGLSIAARIAHLLGGELEFVSRIGTGSTFTLRLPLEWVIADTGPDTARQPA